MTTTVIKTNGPIFVYESFLEQKNNNKNRLKELKIVERGYNGSCIFTIENLFTNELCVNLINFINNNKNICEYKHIGYGNNVECNFISFDKHKNIPEVKDYDNDIFININKVLLLMREKYNFYGEIDSGYTLRDIFGYSKLHIDGVHSKTGGYNEYVRCLSLIILLNDDYEGGVYNFPKQNVSFKAKKGEAVFFPPYWTHPHEVSSVLNNTHRYTINTWILEKFTL